MNRYLTECTVIPTAIRRLKVDQASKLIDNVGLSNVFIVFFYEHYHA